MGIAPFIVFIMDKKVKFIYTILLSKEDWGHQVRKEMPNGYRVISNNVEIAQMTINEMFKKARLER